MRQWTAVSSWLRCNPPIGMVVVGLLLTMQSPVRAENVEPVLVPSEDYAIYNRIIQAKFLTSETMLVLIRRYTATKLGPDEVPFSRAFFDENQLFDGALPPALITDFLRSTARPSRLQPQFDLGVRYRLVNDFNADRDEARGARFVLTSNGPESRLMLEFSRVAFAPKEDQALVYVGQYRLDGTGAGFFVVLQRQANGWEVQDTEVVWTMR
jgi:hypothetical protein